MLRLLAGFEFMNVASMLISKAMPSESVVLINNIFGTMLLCAAYMWCADEIRGGVRERKAGRVALAVLAILGSLAVSAAAIMVFSSQALYEMPQAPAVVFIMQLIPNVMFVEGGPMLVVLGLLFYVFREKRLVQAAALVLMGAVSLFLESSSGSVQCIMLFAAIPILMYNGQRGKGNKYFFYLFYPAHIYVLYIIAWMIKLRSYWNTV
jgi:hypothetical protein